jgi:Carboxypeptidase regulatory-like domain
VFREIVSGPAGTYFASQLVPGRYKIVAKLQGFQTTERNGLTLQVGNTMTVNLALGFGRLEETVRVTAESPLVDTTSVKVGGNIGTAELSELPAMNRNFFATVALLPGVRGRTSSRV